MERTPASAPARAPHLHGRIVALEPLEPKHVEGLWEAAQDARIWTWFPVLAARDRRTFEGWIAEALLHAGDGDQVPFATLDAASGRPLGSTRLQNIRREHRVYEIGSTWLTPTAWGTGANAESKLLLLEHAFEQLGARRVEFKTEATNERSRAALTALPARFEGFFRKHMLVRDGQDRDSAWYAVIDDDWPEVKQHLCARVAASAKSQAAWRDDRRPPLLSRPATRRIRSDDFVPIRTAAHTWWGERDLSSLVQRFLLENFSSTSLVAEDGRTMIGFLIGLVSGDDPSSGYVHLVGVDPAARARGVGTRLYEQFTTLVQARGSPNCAASLRPRTAAPSPFIAASDSSSCSRATAPRPMRITPARDSPACSSESSCEPGMTSPSARRVGEWSTLLTDIVGSTEKAVALGDAAWAELLERHHAVVRAELGRFGGEEMDTSGDGFFAVFPEPAAVVGAALGVLHSVREFELTLRAGVHTGDCRVA